MKYHPNTLCLYVTTTLLTLESGFASEHAIPRASFFADLESKYIYPGDETYISIDSKFTYMSSLTFHNCD